MSLRTEDSLNCPCNGIYKCGLHSIPKFLPYPKINNYVQLSNLVNQYSKKEMDKFVSIYLDNVDYVSPCINVEFPQACSDWWRPMHFAFLENKEYK